MIHIRTQLTVSLVLFPGKFCCFKTKGSGIKKLSTFFTAIYAETFDVQPTANG